MTSQKQTEANRRNALLSTGPRSQGGKQTSRENALKHGLTAETVIVGVEDAAVYAAFEAEILTENDPQSTLERELVLRIASLLWRLRRATLIETGLLDHYCSSSASRTQHAAGSRLKLIRANVRILAEHIPVHTELEDKLANDTEGEGETNSDFQQRTTVQQRLTQSFLSLINDAQISPLERITRYEAALWRQFVQTVFALDAAKRQQFVRSRYRFRPYPPQW